MKTIEEWLNTIADDLIRERALLNFKNSGNNGKRKTLSTALNGAFTWDNVPEGSKYWLDIKHRADIGELETKDLPVVNEVNSFPKTKEVDLIKYSKIKVNNSKESKLIQEKLFKLGFGWAGNKTIEHENKPYIYIYNNYLTNGEDLIHFKEHENKEITLEDLGINLEKEENVIDTFALAGLGFVVPPDEQFYHIPYDNSKQINIVNKNGKWKFLVIPIYVPPIKEVKQKKVVTLKVKKINKLN